MEYQYKTAQTFHSYIPCDLASTHYHYNLWYFNSTSMGKTAMLFFEIRPDKGVFTRLASWLENFHCYYYYTRRRRREKIETLKYFDISSFCSKHAGMWEWKFLKRKSLFYSVYKANLNNPSIPPLLFYRLIWSPTWLNYRNWKKKRYDSVCVYVMQLPKDTDPTCMAYLSSWIFVLFLCCCMEWQ